MAEVIPMSLETPQQLAMHIAQTTGDDIESMAAVFMDKEGEVYITFNSMTPERMLLLGYQLQQFALQL